MKTATVRTIHLAGLTASAATVTARLSGVHRPPYFQVTGLPEPSCRETRVRVRAALETVGVELADHATLLECDHYLTSPSADLAAAIAVLGALGHVTIDDQVTFLGELSLSGEIRATRGVLPALLSDDASGNDAPAAIVPLACEAEGAEAMAARPGLQVFAAGSLRDVLDHLTGVRPLPLCQPRLQRPFDFGPLPAQLAGLVPAELGRRVLLVGAPGTGKTMIARRLAAALPQPSCAELREINCVHSVSFMLNGALVSQRPFRAPHHSCSTAALVGGGAPPRPGEASLAHNGVLFLDELPEFRTTALEALGHVLRDGVATVARAGQRCDFPAAPAMVVAAANPCPCGYHGSSRRTCTCTPERIHAYEERLERACRVLGITERVTLPETTIAALQQGA